MDALDLIYVHLLAPSTPSAPRWNREYQRNKKENKWNYIDGCMLTAFLSIYESTGDERLLDFCTSFFDGLIAADGQITTYAPEERNLDNFNSAMPLHRLCRYRQKPAYQTALAQLEAQLLRQPRNPEGSFWHKRIYPNQVWLDGLYMAMPFYAACAVRHQSNRMQEDILLQFSNAKACLRDPKTGLYFHGYDQTRSACWADPKTGVSACFWLRAIGWLAAALIDTYTLLLPLETAKPLAAQLLDLMQSVLPYRQGNGMFLQLIDQPDFPGNYTETSGSALLAYAMCKGARIGALPPEYLETGKQIYDAICKEQYTEAPTPTLSGICLVAGLGGEQQRDGSAAYYLQEPVITNDAKGIAPLLMVYAELRYKEKNGGFSL